MDAFAAVDDYLMAKHNIGFEDVLCDGCFVGRLRPTLANLIKIVPRLVHSQAEEDGGLANTYEGLVILAGIWYRFRCQIFVDGGGLRFLSDVGLFEPIEWQARAAMSA